MEADRSASECSSLSKRALSQSLSTALPPIALQRASTIDEFQSFGALVREYYKELGVSLDFQMLDEELAGLPGCYAEPAGAIILASVESEDVGCVAVRPLYLGADKGVEGPTPTCEMKRLFVRPGRRGLGLGQQLVEASIEAGRSAGYSTMYLDTLERLTAAHRM